MLMVPILAINPVIASPKDGQQFDDWAAHCEVPRGLEAEKCFIFQNTVGSDGKRLLHVAAGYLTTDQKPAAIVTLPLGVSLPPGIALSVDASEPVRFAVERCDQTGCFGALALTNELLTKLMDGREAKVAFRDGNRQSIAVPISLRGFREGFNALRER